MLARHARDYSLPYFWHVLTCIVHAAFHTMGVLQLNFEHRRSHSLLGTCPELPNLVQPTGNFPKRLRAHHERPKLRRHTPRLLQVDLGLLVPANRKRPIAQHGMECMPITPMCAGKEPLTAHAKSFKQHTCPQADLRQASRPEAAAREWAQENQHLGAPFVQGEPIPIFVLFLGLPLALMATHLETIS